jgi:lysozyme family protein
MADFNLAFKNTMKNEGRYANDPDDSGGETYMGVARNIWPKWKGWEIVDGLRKKPNFPKNLDSWDMLQIQVREFYKANFWDIVKGDTIANQEIAESIFDFAVNAGSGTSMALAKLANKGSYDFTNTNAEMFGMAFTLAKISRYMAICKKTPVKRKYLYNWIGRALNEIN